MLIIGIVRYCRIEATDLNGENAQAIANYTDSHYVVEPDEKRVKSLRSLLV